MEIDCPFCNFEIDVEELIDNDSFTLGEIVDGCDIDCPACKRSFETESEISGGRINISGHCFCKWFPKKNLVQYQTLGGSTESKCGNCGKSVKV